MAQDIVDFEDIYEAVEGEVANASSTDRTTIKKFINRIYRKCVSKILELNRDYYLVRSAAKTLTVDQYQYDFNTDWSLTDVMKPIALLNENDEPLKKGSVRWDIEEFIWIGNRGFRLITKPDTAATRYLIYIQRQADLSATSDTPKIEQIHYDILFWGACYLYYIWKKDKDNVTFYKTFFDEAFAEFIGFHDTDLTNTDRLEVESDGLE